MKKFMVASVLALSCAVMLCAQSRGEPCQGMQPEEQFVCKRNVNVSYDPNEMAGPAGVGAERFVQAGDPMDYTIYFENTTNATAAAIKIAVTLPKDANLDWSTLRLGEVAFGDHTDATFAEDATARSSNYALADLGCEVRTTVTETDESVTWNLRIWDPNTLDHFPDDFNKGVLPPNDPETHCGEGHIRFSVNVRDDAVPGAVVRASASIVFDDNPAIPTDPAWFNTVATIYEPVVDLGDGTTTNLVLVVGQSYGELPTPAERDGFAFAGWFTGPEGSGRSVTAESIVEEGDNAIYAAWTPLTVPMPVFRFYSKAYKGHFFTISEEEKDDLIAHNPNWRYEGPAYRAYTNAAPGTVALYRFYSKNYRGHFFTIDEAEKDGLIAGNPNWRYEGVAYFVYPEEVEGSVPVFRFWSKGYRHHFYTTDAAEKDNLIATNPNWKYETVAFWALPAEDGGAAQARARATANAQCEMRNAQGETLHGGVGSNVAGMAGIADDVDHDDKIGNAGNAGDADSTEALAPWMLVANAQSEMRNAQSRTEDGWVPVVVPGETEIGDMLLEVREETPDAEELATMGAATACRIPLRLTLPDGGFDATLWSAAEGTVAEEEAEGAFDFTLPASGVWHWLRVRDGESVDAFSRWLRAE